MIARIAALPVTTTMEPVLKPFLNLPLSTRPAVQITEGWLYSDFERGVHGHTTHYGIDFVAERGTPVYVSADGWAVGSYHTAYAGEYQKKSVGFGLGNFVQVWHPKTRLFTCYGHLQCIAEVVPYQPPVQENDTWVPRSVLQPLAATLATSRFVRQGEVIGFVGDTGLSWGYEEGPGNRPAPNAFPSWDEVHLHFEVYTRERDGRHKQVRLDPFGIYGDFTEYQSLLSTKAGLWLQDGRSGRPLYSGHDGQHEPLVQ